jgi:hypothetical protein
MLSRQRDHNVGKIGKLANFPASFCGIRAALAPPRPRRRRRFAFTINGLDLKLHLESAAFLFHMTSVT